MTQKASATPEPTPRTLADLVFRETFKTHSLLTELTTRPMQNLRAVLLRSRRTWITEHQRGDAGIGFTTHEYQVSHKSEGA